MKIKEMQSRARDALAYVINEKRTSSGMAFLGKGKDRELCIIKYTYKGECVKTVAAPSLIRERWIEI